MTSIFMYIGPGLGIGTIVMVLIILGIIVVSIGLILWIPIKNFFRKITGRKRVADKNS